MASTTSPLRSLGAATLFLRSASALYGFPGGASYDPICAYACARSLGGNPLSCSTEGSMGMGMEGGVPMTGPECFASNTAFLTTLAWCVNASCPGLPASKLDKFWEGPALGDPNSAMSTSEVTVVPSLTYAEALYSIKEPPTEVLAMGQVLNFTALVDQSTWHLQANTLQSVGREEAVHTQFGVVLLVTGFAVPVVLTLIRALPYMSSLMAYLRPRLTYPSLSDGYHARPLPYGLGQMPTMGQASYISMLVILTLILSAVDYQNAQPHAWYSTGYDEIMAYCMWRTGVLGFAILPLTILFAGRNNVLLWLSDWSHSTFMLLHRWVARIFGLLVILHSILALVLYVKTKSFAATEILPWWIWGVVATLTTVILLVASGPIVRRWSYETFLITHIVMTVLTIVGCWYHIDDLDFGAATGDLQWLYVACAVWALDRAARLLRLLKTGLKRATFTDLGNGYLQIEVPNLRFPPSPGTHAYLYFPTLYPLRPWKNHPFSPVPSSLLLPAVPSSSSDVDEDVITPASLDDKIPSMSSHSTLASSPQPSHAPESPQGLTFFLKLSPHMARALLPARRIPTLVEGLYPNNPTASLLSCDRLLLIAGGIGITALLPYVAAHPNAKLFWSVKESGAGLVRALAPALARAGEREVVVGKRLHLPSLLARERGDGWERYGVVVCGPDGMCDDVRALVVEVARSGKGGRWELGVESYSW